MIKARSGPVLRHEVFVRNDLSAGRRAADGDGASDADASVGSDSTAVADGNPRDSVA